MAKGNSSLTVFWLNTWLQENLHVFLLLLNCKQYIKLFLSFSCQLLNNISLYSTLNAVHYQIFFQDTHVNFPKVYKKIDMKYKNIRNPFLQKIFDLLLKERKKF